MLYNFDEITDRRNTNCEKWDNCEKHFGANNLIPLWVADMDFKTPDFVIEALRKRLEHEILGYHIRPASFYAAIRNWLHDRGWDIDAAKINFSPGIVPAINFAVNLYTDVGDKVLINTPVYTPFMTAVVNHGRTPVTSPLINSGDGYYMLDFDDLERKLASGVKMYLFCSPHNPVGRVWTIDELRKIGELCAKYGVLTVSDEIHSDLIFEPHRHTYLASISPDVAQRTVTFIAPSKTFNLAGLYSSVVYSDNEQLFNQFRKFTNNLCVSSGTIFGDVALEAAYTQGHDWLRQLLEYLNGNFDFVIKFLRDSLPQIKTRKPEGTYLMWLDCSALNMNAKQLQDFMTTKAGLALNSGRMFGEEGEHFLRLNVATQRATLQKALEQLKACF